MTDQVKHISSKDIDSQIKDLDTIQVGIRDEPDSEKAIKIAPEESEKEPLKENYDEIENVSRYATTGDDYHSDLASVHKNVPKNPEYEDGEVNVHDSLIHDLLKKGRPDGETTAKVMDIISESDDDGKRKLNRMYLRHKWIPFLQVHGATHKPKHQEIDDSLMSREEINSIPTKFRLDTGRYLIHEATGGVFYKHPTEGMQYTGTHVPTLGLHGFISPRGLTDSDHLNLRDELFNHYSQFPKTPGKVRYTDGSGAINSYLHKSHLGKLDNWESDDHYADMQDTADSLSDEIRSQPHQTHLPEFHVYTGVYEESNPDLATRVDEHGNKIVHNPSFTSTSLSRRVAIDFGKRKYQHGYDRGVRDVMKIRIPGGYPLGSYLEPHSFYDNEKEYLLDKGHTFKIAPNPKVYSYGGNVVREWEAELHHHNIPEGEFKNMSKADKVLSVLHSDAKPEHLEAAIHDPSIEVQAAAAKHPRLSPELQHHAYETGTFRVHEALFLNPNVQQSLIERAFAEDNPSVKGIARRKDLSQDHISKLTNSNYFSAQSEVAKRPDLTHEHFANLINNGNDAVHAALAGNRHTPRDLLHALSDHSSVAVRKNVAMNSSTSPETIDKLTSDPDATVRHEAKWNPVKFRPK